MVDSLILLDARREVGVIGGVIRVSQAAFLSSQLDPKTTNRGGLWPREKLEPQGGTGSAQRSTGETLSAKYGFEALVSSRCGQLGRAKKCGAESGDPNLRFQPRLPGSVVGEASMRQAAEADKITGVTVLR